MQSENGAPRLALMAMLVLFVLSGVSGLIYQSIWSQYLGLILGHAAYAQSLVLATFMGGMALGAWWAGRLLHRVGSLLRLYGLLEAAIGLFGIGFHAIYGWVSVWLFDHWLPSLPAGLSDAVRYCTAIGLILPQTVLLGMTFPVMCAGLIRWHPATSGRVIGGLYFFNSIGAAGGALLATFALVPAAGLPGAMTFAGALNLLIAAVVILLRVPARAPMRAVLDEHGAITESQRRVLLVGLVAAAITGASSFMYEIGWVRMLSLTLGSSLHAFELMLAAFIGGLAFGGLYIRGRLDHLRNPLSCFGWVQVLMGLCALATLPLYDHAFGFVEWMLAALARSSNGYTLYNLATALVAIAIMVPAAFFAGMTLPTITFALLQRGVGERVIGWVYAANTLGAILGVLLMVHWVLPGLGLKLAVTLAAAIDIALGFYVLRSIGEVAAPRAQLTAMAACVLAVAVVLSISPFDPRRLASGVYRSGKSQLDAKTEIRYLRDGKTASIAFWRNRNGTASIATNGKVDASLALDPKAPPTLDEPTMIMAGLLGLAYHPRPERVANIGFGSGLTTHTMASSPRPKEIVTIEIEPAMIEAARLFGDRVQRAYDDPRSRFVYDDARAYFAGRRSDFDLIVSEPSNPWVNGVAKLFSLEFYEFLPRHLAEGGLLIQWVQAYEISDRTLHSILAALDARFADYAIYTSNNFDLIIVASPRGPLPSLRGEFLKDPGTQELAARIGIRTGEDLIARRVASRRLVRAMLAASGPIANSDFFPTVAHQGPRERYANTSAEASALIYLAPGAALTLLGEGIATTELSTLDPPTLNQPVHTRRRGLALVQALADPTQEDLHALSIGDRADLAFLHEAARRCFRGEVENDVIVKLSNLFRVSMSRLTLEEGRRAWVDQGWIDCEGRLPEGVAAALATFRLALVDQGGAELLASAAAVIQGAARLSPGSLSDFYALAMAGASRARRRDEVEALQSAYHKALPLGQRELLQLDIAANLAASLASEEGDRDPPTDAPGKNE
ncbi:MAG: spermidine synthase [Xanthomonadales bacterium]|nr:Polyamine aminopropyltransferase [Xanthomonadales bacterium]MCC6592249.1 spermidine synthase [Xanthomonadales bacterium]MCE7930685.1 spermidine synthase [Xanthomonadales bacterium PRO6]